MSNLRRPVGTEDFFDEEQPEIEGRAGAPGGEQAAVGHDAFGGENGGQFSGDGGVGRVAATVEETGVVEHGGRRADCGQPAVSGMVAENKWADALISAEEFYARATGEKKAVEERSGGGGEDGGQGRRGLEREAAAAGDVKTVAESGEGDIGARAAE